MSGEEQLFVLIAVVLCCLIIYEGGGRLKAEAEAGRLRALLARETEDRLK